MFNYAKSISKIDSFIATPMEMVHIVNSIIICYFSMQHNVKYHDVLML